jgi:aurora kinase, other
MNSAPVNSAKKLRISNFELLNKMGEGSYSEVYKAVDKSTGFLCALKILAKQQMQEQEVAENVIR